MRRFDTAARDAQSGGVVRFTVCELPAEAAGPARCGDPEPGGPAGCFGCGPAGTF